MTMTANRLVITPEKRQDLKKEILRELATVLSAKEYPVPRHCWQTCLMKNLICRLTTCGAIFRVKDSTPKQLFSKVNPAVKD